MWVLDLFLMAAVLPHSAIFVIFVLMKVMMKILLVMALGLFECTCGAQEAPKGNLTYCSYSCAGAAGLGKDYCELVADPGTTPKVVVALDLGNRFDYPEVREEYPVGPEVVAALQAGLAERQVYKLNGYLVDEAITGGYAHRIYQEYDSGDKVNAYWYGQDVKAEAWSAYNYIAQFFAPWREKARAAHPQEPIQNE